MLLPSTVGMQKAGWAATNDKYYMIDALKLCRIWFMMCWLCYQQPELPREEGPSHTVVLSCNNQQAGLSSTKGEL